MRPDPSPIPIGPDQIVDAMQAIVTLVPGSDLTALFQVVVGEMFIRSGTPPEFFEKWGEVDQKVRTFFDQENCPDPDILEDYLAEQAALQAKMAVRFSNAFETDAEGELQELFKQHGVIDEKNEPPGQYL